MAAVGTAMMTVAVAETPTPGRHSLSICDVAGGRIELRRATERAPQCRARFLDRQRAVDRIEGRRIEKHGVTEDDMAWIEIQPTGAAFDLAVVWVREAP